MANKMVGTARRTAAVFRSAAPRPARAELGVCIPASANALCVICQARADAATEFRPKFFGNVMSVHAVADNLGADKDDQLGAGLLFVLMGKGVAQTRNLIEQGNPVSVEVLLFADQSGQKDRLACRHGNRALDLSFGDRRRQTRGSCR